MENTNKNTNDLMKKEFILFKNVSVVDKYNFYEYLGVMIDGGVSITEALGSVSEKLSSPYFKEKIQELITYISSGDSFSKSMKKIPQIFSGQEVSIIEAGESTGMLSKSLIQLSDDLKKVSALKNKVKGALTYPIIIFLFLTLAVVVVLAYVIPAIKPLFETADVALPVATKALLFVSDFLVNNFGVLLLFITTAVVLFIGYKNTISGKRQIEGFLFGLPLIGGVYRNYILSNISSTLGSLIGAGVNVVKTLTLVGKATNSAIYEELFENIVLRVSKGEKIVLSMENEDKNGEYFPASFLQMLSVGERTANIEDISKKMNAQYDREVDQSLANLTKWIEPLAILLAGIFVLWFAFAIFGAILKVTQVVS